MSQVNTNAIYDASGGNAAKLYGVSMRNGGTGWVNRIINGDMRIDQRNAGASVTPAEFSYTLDRWQSRLTQSSKYSVQQSSTAPSGFPNSLAVTSLSAYSVGASDFFDQRQAIEGLNFSDFGWGTAAAQPATVSFWVRSSLTGTFGGSVKNSAGSRSYPFTYTISAANTWEQKTLTIPGDTTGTWLTTNGIGASLIFGLGVGSTYSGTAGVWASANYLSATGATSVVGTNGATFYITGVQLEAGSVASPFERRPYGTELSLCQRYAASVLVSSFRGYNVSGGNTLSAIVRNPQTMRTSPTVSITVQPSGTANITGSLGIADATPDNTAVSFTGSAAGQSYFSNCTFLATAEL